MPWISVDVEADGPCPGIYSMIAVGAVVVEPTLKHTFKALLRPISEKYAPEALAVSGFTRDQTLSFPPAQEGMISFAAWLAEMTKKFNSNSMFCSDNNGFDFSFVNYYFWQFCGNNPFGHSSMNIGSLYKGLVKDGFKNFKHLRKTKHDHDPVNDAMGNAEALIHMVDKMEMGLRIC